jgi:hypothetical protein
MSSLSLVDSPLSGSHGNGRRPRQRSASRQATTQNYESRSRLRAWSRVVGERDYSGADDTAPTEDEKMHTIKTTRGGRLRTTALAGLVAMAAAPMLSGAAPAAATTTTTTTYYHTIMRQFSDDGVSVDRGHTFNGEPIVSWPPHVEQHNTQWLLDFVPGSAPAPGFSNVFALRARHSNQCVDVSGAVVAGAPLVQQPCDPAKQTQQWYYGPESDSGSATYRHIYNRAAGLPGSTGAKVMKVKDGGPRHTPIVLANKDAFGSTRFFISAPFRVTSTTEILG